MQIVFQDPYSSLNPRMRARRDRRGAARHPPHRQQAGAPRAGRGALSIWSVSIRRIWSATRTSSAAASGSASDWRARSRSIRQFVVLDEPVSALDVSVQAQVVNLLLDLQQRLQLTYLFIAHDLRLVAHICRRIAVCTAAASSSSATTAALFGAPQHPYTRALLSAVPLTRSRRAPPAHTARPAVVRRRRAASRNRGRTFRRDLVASHESASRKSAALAHRVRARGQKWLKPSTNCRFFSARAWRRTNYLPSSAQRCLGADRDLAAQLNRASVRVVSDIAEGFEQKTDRHFARYLYDARGGAAEIRAQLGIARRRGSITANDCERVSDRYAEVGRMLSGLIAYLESEGREHRWKKERGEPA